MKNEKSWLWLMVIVIMLALFVYCSSVFAAGPTAISSSTSSSSAGATGVGIGGDQQQQQQQGLQSTQTANPQAIVNQNFEATKIPAGAYRSNIQQVVPGGVTIPAFFGPFVPGWKVLDDLTSITKLTMKEAETLGGGAECILKVKSTVKWEMDQVNILYQYDRKTMPEPIGWIFCTADGETTIDIIADAAKLAMGVGGTDLVLLKHKVEFSTSGWGLFLSGGYTHGQLSGSEKEDARSTGGVGGLGYGKTKGVSDDGLVFGILRR